MKQYHTVTGAFGYSGAFIARELLQKGLKVNTLTNSKKPSPLREQVPAYAFHFDDPDRLAQILKSTHTLYNNYWVRFNHERFTHNEAVQNTFTLINAAKAAGVKRFVHISITNPSVDSPLEYFNGKAAIEEHLQNSGLSYNILRPPVLFGENDILINNIAWMIRHFPFFCMFGDGNYRLQPVHAGDLAKIAVQKGLETGVNRQNEVVNVIGPETYTFKELAWTIASAFEKHRGKKTRILACPPPLVYAMGKFLGLFLRDIPVTRYEIQGLMDELLYVESPQAIVKGKTSLSRYIVENINTLGRRYASELARRRS